MKPHHSQLYVREGSCQVAEILPNNLKGAVKNILWLQIAGEFCKILTFFYPEPSKNSADFLGFGNNFF